MRFIVTFCIMLFLSVISQNPYSQSRYGVTIRRQIQYVTCFPNSLDKHPIISLGRQIRPEKPYWLSKCFDILMKEEKIPTLQYIFIDAHQDSTVDKALQFRTNIFDKYPFFFIINDKN